MPDVNEQTDVKTDADASDDGRPAGPKFSLDIDDGMKNEILTYLLAELDDVRSSRVDREKKWQKWRRQREAIPESTPAEHSLSNASRIEPPLSQIHAQTAYAKVKGYYDTGKPWFWQVKSASDDPDDHEDAKLLTKYLGLLANSQMDLNMEKIKRIVSDEATFMGFLMVKVVWDTLEWQFKSDDESGIDQTMKMIFHDGPSIIPISQEDIYYPPFWDEVQRMPWIGHELHMPLHEFENKIAQGYYDAPTDMNGLEIDPKTWLRESFTDSEMANEKMRGFAPRAPKVIDLMEFHFFWDIDSDGTWEDLIFTIHVNSKSIVRKVYNSIAEREFESFGFIPRSFMLESRGVGQICEGLQDEASGTHRLRNDGMKLSSIKMMAIRRAVLRENKNTIYQGKIWVTENPKEDMTPISLGEVPASSLQSENLVWTLASQAVGVSSPDRGFADPTLGSRDTARGQQMRMQQSQGIMSTIIESMSEAWARVGMLVVFQLVRNVKRVVWNERQLGRLKDEEIVRLERILSMPISEVPRRLKFEIYTTDIEHNYQTRRDTMMKLMEMTFQAQPQLIQLSQALFGPQGMQLKQAAPMAWEQMLQVYVGSVNLLKEVYTFADFTDTENYLQDVSMLEKLIQTMRATNAQQMQSLDAVRNQGGMNGGIGSQTNPGGSAGPGAGPAGAGAGNPGGIAGAEVPGQNEGAGAGA
jgi:hypothetical protein